MLRRGIPWVCPPCLTAPLFLGVPRTHAETQQPWKAAGLQAVHTFYLWYQPAARGKAAVGSRKADLPSSEGLRWKEQWKEGTEREGEVQRGEERPEDKGVLIVLILLQIRTNEPDCIHECFAGPLPVSDNRWVVTSTIRF